MNNVNEIFNFYIKSNNSLSPSSSKDFLISLIEHESNKIEFLNCLEYNNLSHKIFTLWNSFSSFDLEKILKTYYIKDISKCLLEDLFLPSYTVLRNHDHLNIDIIKYLKNISTVFKQSIKKTLIMYDINNKPYYFKVNEDGVFNKKNRVLFLNVFPTSLVSDVEIINYKINYILYSDTLYGAK